MKQFSEELVKFMLANALLLPPPRPYFVIYHPETDRLKSIEYGFALYVDMSNGWIIIGDL